MHYDIIKEYSFDRKAVFLSLLSIGIVGLLVRLYFAFMGTGQKI